MRFSLCQRRPALLAAIVLVAGLVTTDAHARLSVIPGRATPRPTSSSVAPTPSPASTAGGSVGVCQAQIAGESARLLADVRSALGTCLTRGARCLVDEGGSSACCEASALECQSDLNTIAAATRRFRETVRSGACAALSLERLLAEDGLGFPSNVCGSLTPPIVVGDHASFADCMQLLMTKDVLHQVALTDVPRAPEALVCMGLDEVLAASLGEEPATCKPTPSPSPSATPIPTSSPIPTASPTPGPPTPTPTPSPGANGCQPRLFGPCEDAPFTGCCNVKHHCAFITGDDGPGYCIADPVSPTETPAPTATPDGTVTPVPTSTATGATPSPTSSPIPTATPGVTPTPAPTASPAEPTPISTGAATCTTATVTLKTSYQAQSAPDFVAGVTMMLHYPGDALDVPGTGNQSTVLARVTNLSGANGLFSAGDQDSDQSGSDDLLSVGLISTGSAVAPGDFARVLFDCVAGKPAPTADDFDCAPDVSSLFGNTVEATCSVSVATAR